MEWEEFKKESLKDHKLKAEYEKLEPDYKIIRQVLSFRIKNKITQTELARLVNVKKSIIAKLEDGIYNPSLKLLKKIAEATDSKLDIKFISKTG